MVGLCREGNCHLHLGCTFLDGGVKAEKDWLGPLLAPFISDAAKQLRVSDDMNQLYRAQAKGCGEGWDLYGNGEGAKNLRPFLLGKYPKRLFLKLERFDKGVRMWGSTKVIVFSIPYIRSLLFTSGSISHHTRGVLAAAACSAHTIATVFLADRRNHLIIPP